MYSYICTHLCVIIIIQLHTGIHRVKYQLISYTALWLLFQRPPLFYVITLLYIPMNDSFIVCPHPTRKCVHGYPKIMFPRDTKSFCIVYTAWGPIPATHYSYIHSCIIIMRIVCFWLGSTNRKEVHAWKYHCSSCVCIQECPDHIETLTYSE